MNKEIKLKYIEKLKQLNSNERFCLYIDFPFCKSKCTYCIYKSMFLSANIDNRKAYVEEVLRQLDYYSELFEIRTPDALYFGGGTPSLWGLDELLRIKELIPQYDKIQSKKTEAHPSDMTSERIAFYAKEMKFDIVSLGVQSFDKESCKGQKRIWVSEHKVKEIVDSLHAYGVRVNIDLVALFNGDMEENWLIFDEDMTKTCNYVQPDVITSIPNYKTSLDYLSQIPRFRTILKKHVGDLYFPPSERMLSLDDEAIKHYGGNDHWIATLDYWRYQNSHIRYSSSAPSPDYVPENQILLAIGGAGEHYTYGYIPDEFIIHSKYDFEQKKFIHSLNYLRV